MHEIEIRDKKNKEVLLLMIDKKREPWNSKYMTIYNLYKDGGTQ